MTGQQIIWKYEFDVCDDFVELSLPVGAEVLSAGVQRMNKICLWAKVDPNEAKKTKRRFVVYGTGRQVDTMLQLSFVATVFDGAFVWHVFEVMG